MIERKLKVLIVEARFYERIQDALLDGAKSALDAFGAEYDVITVPGALEVPIAIAMADHAGQGFTGVSYDGYVALGCVIRGETTHYDVVCNETARGIQHLAVTHEAAVGFGILTVENDEQAWARAKIGGKRDAGGAAARACLRMIELKRQFRLG
jgi:6,7-dimethyl-8-ribityllumazine synthase